MCMFSEHLTLQKPHQLHNLKTSGHLQGQFLRHIPSEILSTLYVL